MEGHCSTGLSPQWAVVPMEEEEEEDKEEEEEEGGGEGRGGRGGGGGGEGRGGRGGGGGGGGECLDFFLYETHFGKLLIKKYKNREQIRSEKKYHIKW